MPAPNVAVLKGDQAAACVAAASVLAKVTRDRIMADLHDRHPEYGFTVHKGYCTPDHTAALMEHGPCAEHRWSYVNVAAAAAKHGLAAPHRVARGTTAQAVVQNDATPADAGELATSEGAEQMTRAEA
jgi:ribonuclease HII